MLVHALLLESSRAKEEFPLEAPAGAEPVECSIHNGIWATTMMIMHWLGVDDSTCNLSVFVMPMRLL